MSTEEKFYLFAYEGYYPEGAFNDLLSIHPSLESAERALKTASGDWADIATVRGNLPTMIRKYKFVYDGPVGDPRGWTPTGEVKDLGKVKSVIA